MLRTLACCWLFLAFVLAAQAAPNLTVVPDHENGVYEIGQTATWQATMMDDANPVEGDLIVRIQPGGYGEAREQTVTLKDGKATFTTTRETAGALLINVRHATLTPAAGGRGAGGARGAQGGPRLTATLGVVFGPREIRPSQPAPADFDAFWTRQMARLRSVPANVQLEKVDIGDAAIEYYKITMDNVDGRKVYGHLARPVGKTDLPALLQVQSAGVYGLPRNNVINKAKEGWLSLNIMPHDLPYDQEASFYQEQNRGPLSNYWTINNDDRETSYFLPMFLSCVRAVDYLVDRPDWNKRSLVVWGGSQGGWLSLVTAGLHPAVTGAAADVPAGSDHTGWLANRASGWPNWVKGTRNKDEAKMAEAARYFDTMNFASRIKCPVVVGVGLLDTTCPPEGVMAALNQITTVKELAIMPTAGHQGAHSEYQKAFAAFMAQHKVK